MKKIKLILAFVLLAATASGQEMGYKFRLSLSDKGKTKYSIKKPHEFLSPKALERRAKQALVVDKTDFPISAEYIKEIEKTGAIVVAKSKWQSTVSIHTADSMLVDKLTSLPFVSKAELVWRSTNPKKQERLLSDSIEIKANMPTDRESPPKFFDYYGYAAKNIRTVNGQYLHEAGYTGQGMDIAVIDAGYKNYPLVGAMESVKLLGVKNFVYKEAVYNDWKEYEIQEKSNSHGLNVLSTMATNQPYYFVGTAPDAKYLLLTSEDSSVEFPIEEDYWAMAIEYADSLGVDVVNSSLGYTEFDTPIVNLEHKDLDGQTAYISRSAEMASRKGILVISSAGNSGNSAWRKLTPPSDARGVLAVGAMKSDSTLAAFSSQGYTADLRVKPDVVALGHRSAVIDDDGYEAKKNGTSFSSPIICGLAACLWQAYPSLTNIELLRVIRDSAHKRDMPDPIAGYGIPDMKKAMELAKELQDKKTK